MSIKAAQERSGKRIGEVCKYMNVSRTTWHKWARGDGFPRTDKLPKLAAYFGVTVDELLAPD